MANIVHTFKTKDGLLVAVRSMQPDDAPHLVDIFEHMSLDSRYSRFNMAMPNPDPALVAKEAAEMTDFERPESDGWLAFADLPDSPETPVAGIRYIYTGPGEAEVALSVRDDMQNKGIGTALFLFILDEARKAGIRRLVGLARRDNLPLLQLLFKAPFTIQRTPEGGFIHLETRL